LVTLLTNRGIIFKYNNSVLYLTNDAEQVPYLLAVKCGDERMMKLTIDGGKLENYEDKYGRNAVYFSVFSHQSAIVLFRGSTWYAIKDAEGSQSLHYAILHGRESVVEHILFTVIPKLSVKEQRVIFESYDSQVIFLNLYLFLKKKKKKKKKLILILIYFIFFLKKKKQISNALYLCFSSRDIHFLHFKS